MRLREIPTWVWLAGGGLGILGLAYAGRRYIYRGWNEAQVRAWISQALTTLSAVGADTSEVNPDDLVDIAYYESSGDPGVTQKISDVNSEAGTPAEGLMQTVPSTFRSYAISGHGDIWNPVDNIIASVRYILHRYGSTANVPGILSLASGGSYVGY